MEWQNGKASQRTVGDHYCEQNLLVYSNLAGLGSASSPIEFELTRNQHMKDPHVCPTLTARFKDPTEGLIGEAWRILLAATDGKQLLPGHVQEYCRSHVARWEGGDSNEVDSDTPLLATREVLTRPSGQRAMSSTALVEASVRDSAQSSPALPLGSGCDERGTAVEDVHDGLGAAAESDPTPNVSPRDKKLKESAAAKGSAAAVQQKREEEKIVGKAKAEWDTMSEERLLPTSRVTKCMQCVKYMSSAIQQRHGSNCYGVLCQQKNKLKPRRPGKRRSSCQALPAMRRKVRRKCLPQKRMRKSAKQ